jgi:hypothetical protein
MADVDYNDLLIKDNFVDWMDIISKNDPDPIIRQSAKEVGWAVNGNSQVSPKPSYQSLYAKYSFIVVPIKTENGLKSQLYSYNGPARQKFIGIIYAPGVVYDSNCCGPLPTQ